MAQIFISYSRRDTAFAKRLTEEIKARGYDLWIDWEEIPPSVDWMKQIERGIEEADIFVFILSPDSAASKICREEIAHAVKNGKRLIPVVAREIKSEEAPADISHINWIFFNDKEHFTESFDKLITVIHTDYDWVQAHRNLQVKALEWEKNNHESGFLLHGKEFYDAEIQLVQNTSKQPYPTALQREYVLKSRQRLDRQRRLATEFAIVAILLFALLSVFAMLKANEASRQASVALTAQADAKVAQIIAENDRAVALNKERESQQQAQIATARMLGGQAYSLFNDKNADQTLAVLLAVQAMRLHPNFESALVLQNNILAYPISSIQHDDSVLAVDFSPNGKYAASGGEDKIARVWKISTGEEIARFEHGVDVKAIAFSPDGRYVLSGGCDEKNIQNFCVKAVAKVWEAQTGAVVSSVEHGGSIYAVAFSPDGKYGASGSADKSVVVWEAATGMEINRFVADNAIASIDFSPDGQYIAAGGADNKIHVWKIQTGAEMLYMQHDNWVNSVAFSRDGMYIVSSSMDNTARVWDVTNGREVARMTHANRVKVAQFSPNGKYVITGGWDGTAHVWNTFTGTEISHKDHKDVIYAAAFSPDGKHVLSASADGTVRIWDFFTGQESAHIAYDDQAVLAAAFNADGKYMLTGSSNKVATVWQTHIEHDTDYIFQNDWATLVGFSPNGRFNFSGGGKDAKVIDATTGRELFKVSYAISVNDFMFSADSRYVIIGGDNIASIYETATGNRISAIEQDNIVQVVAFSPDGKYAAAGNRDSSVRVWDISTRRTLLDTNHDSWVTSIAFTPDSAKLISGSLDKTLRVWDLKTGGQTALMNHGDLVRFVDVSSEGNLALSSGGAAVRVWDLNSGKQVSEITCRKDCTAAVFSPDGKNLVYASGRTAFMWDIAANREVARMTHERAVTSVEFSPDGKYVVSGGGNTARIWEIFSGQEVARMTQPGIAAAAFSKDGKYIISGGCVNLNQIVSCTQGSAQIWEWRAPDLIIDACSRVTRNLTLAEWKQYISNNQPYGVICPNLPPNDANDIAE